jgi:putative hemolysin
MNETEHEPTTLRATIREVAGGPRHRLQLRMAKSVDEVHAAQRLRHRVFAGELGARLAGKDDRDEDFFDAWCEHLIVVDAGDGAVVGTYRLLPAERAQRLGTFYADGEFDLTRLAHLKPRMVEIGRACVDPAHRSGAVLMLLWHGIAEFMRRHRYDYLIGCASIGMQDGGVNAQRVYEAAAESHLAPIEYRVFPRHRLMPREGPAPERAGPLQGRVPEREVRSGSSGPAPEPPQIPPLLKGYLRVGAWVGGEPAWDPDFNTADLFVLLPLSRLGARYARHYCGAP